MPTEIPPLAVSLLALPETTPTTLYGFVEVFSAVGVAWGELTGEVAPVRRMAPRIVARAGQSFRSPAGPPIAPDAAFADAGQADVVIVTDLALGDGRSPRGRWPEEAAWLCRQFDAGATVCSVCTGAVLLAEAGLLDGQEATTHWSAARIFAEHYPKVRLRPERLLCPSGADQRIVTGGGAGSWADLALYLVARFAGPAEAVRIAKVFVLGDRSDGQLVYSAMARPRDHGDAAIGACQRWIAGNYAVPNPVTAMVGRSGLSERSFKRRFRAATGYTPIDYVQALRIEEARQMLETTGEPVEAVAQAVGYEDPTFFRRLFKRLTGVSPGRYRRHYAAMILPGRIGAGAG